MGNNNVEITVKSSYRTTEGYKLQATSYKRQAKGKQKTDKHSYTTHGRVRLFPFIPAVDLSIRTCK